MAKSKSIIVKLIIKIDEIKIEDKYFSFYYEVWINGILQKEDTFSDSHTWSNQKIKFRNILKKGWAADLVLSKLQLSNTV